tara:strand:+ start:1337 stop:1987 length:651 start_codon:yes stop_codon:yes gene_type:complete
MADDDGVSEDLSKDTESSSNDIEEWTNTHKEDIIRLIEKSKVQKEYHRVAAQYCQKWGHILELPPILFPIILAPISSTFDSYNWVVYMNMTGFIISGLLAAIVKHYNFSVLAKEHIDISRSYVELKDNLRNELNKKKIYRTQVTEFINSSYKQYHNLMNISPFMEQHIINKVKVKKDEKKNSNDSIEKKVTKEMEHIKMKDTEEKEQSAYGSLENC